MTCKQLAGPCDQQFHADTFEEMVKKSQEHGMEMAGKGDADHIKVMEEMRVSMEKSTPEETKKWMDEHQKVFDAMPDDK